ncbi:hypothetical protein OTB20_39315 [Streptomyces sp. H27-H1]|uniref:DUF4394 domain-containing protein n=1 Tax=Streptomyces sp. H27-H1 TaxID=2996461 RepID=UPI00226E3F2F|nr:DUF4394 domain-containing protein [Streptomyces sp. H27-H1]MCY0932121.1 hypothetical protein [Streptomyces sp. H27-H1]
MTANAAPAGPHPSCPTADRGDSKCVPSYWVNDGGIEPFELRQYSPTGALLRTVTVEVPFYDIATNSDGSQLYGVETSTPTTPNRLHTINPATGASTSVVTITGLPDTESLNGLSLRPNGMLLAGSGTSNTLYEINPVTGVATALPVSLAPGRSLSGDIITLRDGDLLAIDIGAGTPAQTLVRIHPDGTRTVVGTLPDGIGFYGLTVSGGQLFIAGGDGAVYRLPAPPTAPSNQPLPLQQVVAASAGVSWYGAASVEDSGCKCSGGKNHRPQFEGLLNGIDFGV